MGSEDDNYTIESSLLSIEVEKRNLNNCNGFHFNEFFSYQKLEMEQEEVMVKNR